MNPKKGLLSDKNTDRYQRQAITWALKTHGNSDEELRRKGMKDRQIAALKNPRRIISVDDSLSIEEESKILQCVNNGLYRDTNKIRDDYKNSQEYAKRNKKKYIDENIASQTLKDAHIKERDYKKGNVPFSRLPDEVKTFIADKAIFTQMERRWELLRAEKEYSERMRRSKQADEEEVARKNAPYKPTVQDMRRIMDGKEM